MKNSPKNFYNVVDKKKLGIDEAVAVAGEVEQLKTTVGDSSFGLVKQVNDLQTTVDNIDYDISRKADIDGSYPDMTVGNADQLNSTQMITDKVPYVFRTSGGSNDIGNREHDKLVGGTLAFNQNIGDVSGNMATISNIAANEYKAVSSGGANYFGFTLRRDSSTVFKPITNHKYIIIFDLVEVSVDDLYNIRLSGGGSANFDGTAGEKSAIFVGSDSNTYLTASSNSTSLTTDYITVKNINVFDITQMFGTTVADQINTLEQAQSGSGVALFRKLFPKAYYTYNAGQLMSVKAIAHEMVGFNAYDHATGTAKLLGGNEYQITGTYAAIAYEDINGNAETITPDASGIFTPTNNGIMTVTGGNDTDTCIHLTWTGYRNGEFEPYIKRTYILDQDLELRGVAKVDGNGNIYYDGDTYESDGTVTRSYGIVDLSTLSWTYQSDLTRFFTKGLENVIKSESSSDTPNLLCSKYYIAHSFTYAANKQIYVGTSGSVFIKDNDYTTVEAFTASLSGVYLVYEIDTPTTESADGFQDPQWVDDFGTEEYVDTRAIPVPVGHITQYPANLRDKLQHLPSPTGVDGDYIIREDTEVMTLVPAPTRVPELPSVDGTYVLTCTVSDGTATLSWTSNA